MDTNEYTAVQTAPADAGTTRAAQLILSAAPLVQALATAPVAVAPGKPAYKTPAFWTNILATAAQAAPGILQATRASANTSNQVQVGLMAAALLLSVFNQHPALSEPAQS